MYLRQRSPEHGTENPRSLSGIPTSCGAAQERCPGQSFLRRELESFLRTVGLKITCPGPTSARDWAATCRASVKRSTVCVRVRKRILGICGRVVYLESWDVHRKGIVQSTAYGVPGPHHPADELERLKEQRGQIPICQACPRRMLF